MRQTMNRFAFLAVLTAGLTATQSALADIEWVSFDSFSPNSVYASWADPNVATLTSGPTSFTVESVDFGGGFYNVIPDVDASAETTVELDVTINSGPTGVVLVLGDSDFTEKGYGWFGLPVGNHTLTLPLNSPTFPAANGADGILNLSALDYIHIQVDDGAGANFYNVSYNNLRFTGAVPEPTTMAMLVCGMVGVVFARRRRG